MLGIIISALLILPALSGQAWGQFWNEGFSIPRARSDFGGYTSFSWLPNGCLFDAFCPAPPYVPFVGGVFGGDCDNCDNSYTANNYFTYNYASQSTYWVVGHNIDAYLPGYSPPLTAFTNHCLSGPPDQSAPVNTPAGSPIFGVTHGNTGPGGSPEWYIGVEPQFLPNCNPGAGIEGIPFISIGADSRRGNGTRIGQFYSSDPGQWTRTGVDAYYRVIGTGPQSGGAVYYVVFISEWQGKPRGVFVEMARRGTYATAHGQYFRWNFPNSRSFWARLPSTNSHIGGTDFAFLDALQLGTAINGCSFANPSRGCLPIDGEQRRVQINAAGVFEQASAAGLFTDPMPSASTVKHLYGVHWVVESDGPSFSGGIAKMITYSG